MEAIFLRGARRALSRRLHIAVMQSSISAQPLSVHKPEKELALLWSVAAPNGTSEWVIRHAVKGDEIVIFRGWNFPIFS